METLYAGPRPRARSEPNRRNGSDAGPDSLGSKRWRCRGSASSCMACRIQRLGRLPYSSLAGHGRPARWSRHVARRQLPPPVYSLESVSGRIILSVGLWTIAAEPITRAVVPLRNGLLHSIADDRRFHGQCHSVAGPYCRNITGACFCVRVGYGATNELATDSSKSELVSANHFAVAVSSVARRLPPCTLGSQPSRHTGPLTETHPGRLGRGVGPLR